MNSVYVKPKITFLGKGFPALLARKFVNAVVYLIDVGGEILEPATTNTTLFFQVEVSGLVVDVLHLTVPEHPATVGHPAGQLLLLLTPSVLVHQVRLQISELSCTDVTDCLIRE